MFNVYALVSSLGGGYMCGDIKRIIFNCIHITCVSKRPCTEIIKYKLLDKCTPSPSPFVWQPVVFHTNHE